MGQYKVPQNVEAEDKIIGPLTLKQFLYAIAGVGVAAVTWVLGKLIPPLYFVGAVPTILLLMLAFFQPNGQPFESMFLAMVSFFVKSRKRLWIKEPIAEVFKIETPKPVVEGPAVDPREVYGQLEKLSQIVDTRGWSSKQPELQEPTNLDGAGIDYEDRLGGIQVSNTAFEPIVQTEVGAADDIFDQYNNSSVQQLDHLIEDTVRNQRAQITNQIQQPTPPETTTSVMTDAPSTAILKEAMERSELKVSQIAAAASRTGNLTEGQAVSINDRTQDHQSE